MMARPTDRVVVMGVSAVGKSTIGLLLAQFLQVSFIDADDLHTSASIKKMASGAPLDHADRLPWLVACGRALQQERNGAVIACSALTRASRDLIRHEAPGAIFAHLCADTSLILQRAHERTGHFMPSTLLASQEAALQPLEPEEPGFTFDASLPPLQLVHKIQAFLTSQRR